MQYFKTSQLIHLYTPYIQMNYTVRVSNIEFVSLHDINNDLINYALAARNAICYIYPYSVYKIILTK